MNRTRLLSLFAVATSLLGYLEWGQGRHQFLAQMEAEVLAKAAHDPASVLHPLVILPFLGQLLLLAGAARRRPSVVLTLAGLVGIGSIMLVVLIVGGLSTNARMLLSTVPFLIVATLAIVHLRRGRDPAGAGRGPGGVAP